MYVVAAFDHEGRPYGSTKVATRDEAERASERYIGLQHVARVEIRKVLPAMTTGNGRYR